MDMKYLLEAMHKFAGEPDQKPGDQVRGTEKAKPYKKEHPFKNRLVGENLLAELEDSLRSPNSTRTLAREFEEFKTNGGPGKGNLPDVIAVDVPLMIRIFEFIREDVKDDVDLHRIAEKLVQLSASGNVLSMDKYEEIVGRKIDEYGASGTAIGPNASAQAAGGTGTGQQPIDPKDKLEIDRLKQSVQKLKPLSAKGLDIQKTTTALDKADSGQALNPGEEDQISKLAPILADLLKNPTSSSSIATTAKQANAKDIADQLKKAQT
jgi:hypothetical protein